MDHAKLRISFSALPARPRGLDLSEISKVFGGCTKYGEQCGLCDCCDGYICDFLDPQQVCKKK